MIRSSSDLPKPGRSRSGISSTSGSRPVGSPTGTTSPASSFRPSSPPSRPIAYVEREPSTSGTAMPPRTAR
jgi:hypothetical protein